MSALPSEIWETIIRYASQDCSALFSLLLVSRGMAANAYNSIRVLADTKYILPPTTAKRMLNCTDMYIVNYNSKYDDVIINLPNLRYLFLNGTRFLNVVDLSMKTRMTDIVAWRNILPPVSLTRLSMTGNTTIVDLSKFTQLTKLELRRCPSVSNYLLTQLLVLRVDKYSPVGDLLPLLHLEELQADGNILTQLPPTLKKLELLSCNDALPLPICLSTLTCLQTLKVEKTRVSDIPSMVTFISVNQSKISLSTATNLTSLCASHSEVCDAFTSLKTLKLFNASINSLGSFDNLYKLSIDMPVGDSYQALSMLTNLRSLHICARDGVCDVSALTCLTQLHIYKCTGDTGMFLLTNLTELKTDFCEHSNLTTFARLKIFYFRSRSEHSTCSDNVRLPLSLEELYWCSVRTDFVEFNGYNIVKKVMKG